MAAIADLEFNEWTRRWMELAKFSGKRLPDEERRIAHLVALWHELIPPRWERARDSRLLDRERRYCRRKDGVCRGEYVIEGELRDPIPAEANTICLGGATRRRSQRCASREGRRRR